jgi:hypothetical protein
MKWRSVISAAVLGGALAAAGGAAGASPAESSPAAPAYAGDFPDPFIMVLEDTYWAYSTGSAGRNLQVVHSPDLETWSEPLDPLPELPGWARAGHTWAPTVARIDDRFLMYYTVRHAAADRQCISVASADGPTGPFLDERDEPLLCQLERFGSIDPAVFAENGELYLLWKSEDNAGGQPTTLWAQRLAADGLTLLDEPVHLLDQSHRWQKGIIEGPAMVATGRGDYLLFYGAGDWWSAFAGVGYATCETPLGPCTDQSTGGPWLGARPGALGPAGPAPFVDRDGVSRLAYHAWTEAVGYDHGGARSLFVGTLLLDLSGRPVLSELVPLGRPDGDGAAPPQP